MQILQLRPTFILGIKIKHDLSKNLFLFLELELVLVPFIYLKYIFHKKY